MDACATKPNTLSAKGKTGGRSVGAWYAHEHASKIVALCDAV